MSTVHRLIINNEIEKTYGYLEIPDQCKAIIIFSHGLLSGVKESQRFSYIKRILHSHNMATLGFYYPAHGPLMSTEYSIKESVDILEKAILHSIKLYPKVPRAVLGISVGSSIISYLNKRILKQIDAFIFFSLISDLSIFNKFKFNWRHYKRWKTFGYSVPKAENIYQTLVKQAKNKKYSSGTYSRLLKITKPKLVIHGLNDRVSHFKDIASCIDDHSTLLVLPGIEGRHDIKGQSLHCAANYCVDWLIQHLKL